MSTSINQSRMEREQEISQAITSRNLQELRRLALLEVEEGNEEYAEILIDLYNNWLNDAREIRDEMRREELEAEKEERETYYAETYMHPSEGR